MDFCKQFYPNLQRRNRQLIKPYELDIVIPELHLAIEFNGSYWHSVEAGVIPGYHLMKTELCEAKNYRLIHIWEDEWSDSLKLKLKAVLERKEEVNAEKKLDHSWFKKEPRNEPIKSKISFKKRISC